jgi:hypothetical protein
MYHFSAADSVTKVGLSCPLVANFLVPSYKDYNHRLVPRQTHVTFCDGQTTVYTRPKPEGFRCYQKKNHKLSHSSEGDTLQGDAIGLRVMFFFTSWTRGGIGRWRAAIWSWIFMSELKKKATVWTTIQLCPYIVLQCWFTGIVYYMQRAYTLAYQCVYSFQFPDVGSHEINMVSANLLLFLVWCILLKWNDTFKLIILNEDKPKAHNLDETRLNSTTLPFGKFSAKLRNSSGHFTTPVAFGIYKRIEGLACQALS